MKTDMLAPPDLRVVGSRFTVAGAGQFSLKAMGTGKLPDGALVYVQSVQAYFQLTRSSTSTPDDITVVRAALGAGNWHRKSADFSGPSSWLSQSTWYIDADNGSDENDGATAATALATHAEFERRMGSNLIVSSPITVHILSDLEEVLRLKAVFRGSAPIAVPPGGYIHYVGQPTVLATGTAGGYQAPNTGVLGQIDPGADLAAFEGMQMRFLNTGEDDDPRTFIGPLVFPPFTVRCGRATYFAARYYSLGSFNATGADYQIVSLPRVAGFDLDLVREDVGVSGPSGTANVVFEDLLFEDNPGEGGFIAHVRSEDHLGGWVVFFGCQFAAALLQGGSYRLVACGGRNSEGTPGSLQFENADVQVSCHAGGGIVLDNRTVGEVVDDSQLDLLPLRVQNDSYLSDCDCGVWDASGSFAALVDWTSQAIVTQLWGMNPAVSYGMQADGRVFYVNKPSITGSTPATNDAIVGGTVRAAWATGIPYVEPTNNAMIVVRP